jgi:parallel beta-helix repeat protein
VIDGVVNPSNATYQVNNNLSFAGAAGAGAITVNAGVHDIVINFNGFDLNLVNGQEVGIQLLGTTLANVTNVLIENGTIASTAATVAATCDGINLTNPSNTTNAQYSFITVKNMNFNNLSRDIRSFNPTDVTLGLKVQSCNFLNGVAGVFFTNSTVNDMMVSDCTFTNMSNSAIGAGGTPLINNMVIQRCSFTSTLQPIVVGGSPDGLINANITITECDFSKSTFTTINLVSCTDVQITKCNFTDVSPGFANIDFANNVSGNPSASGCLIDSCTFNLIGTTMSPLPAYQAMRGIQIGRELTNLVNGNGVIIRNCTFTHINEPSFAMDILVFGGDSILIENNLFYSNSTGYLSDCTPPTHTVGSVVVTDKSANIHLGSFLGTLNVTNVTVRGNQIGTKNQVGIYSTTGTFTTPNSNIVIEDNNITAREAGILFENTIASSISNNHISGVSGSSCATGIGIYVAGPPSYNPTAQTYGNAILYNTVTNNQIGIQLDQGAKNNLIRGNNIFQNSIHQVVEAKKHDNVFKDNVIFREAKKCKRSKG